MVSAVSVLLNNLFSFQTNVNVPTLSNKQKNLGENKIFFVGMLNATEEESRIRIRICNPVVRIRGLGSVSRRHGHTQPILRKVNNYYTPLDKVKNRVPHPRVFWPPGSGSTSQRYGSRSGSGSGSFYHHAKIIRKILNPTIL
jgi:hypothetical protein